MVDLKEMAPGSSYFKETANDHLAAAFTEILSDHYAAATAAAMNRCQTVNQNQQQ